MMSLRYTAHLGWNLNIPQKNRGSRSGLQVTVFEWKKIQKVKKGLWKVEPEERILSTVQVFFRCWTLPVKSSIVTLAKWITFKSNSQGYGRSKTATWLFPSPWQTSFLFDGIKPSLAAELICPHEGKFSLCFTKY